VFGATVADRTAFAAALGVDTGDLGPALPQSVSCGVPFLLAPLLSRRAVDAVTLDARAYAGVCRASGLDTLPLFVFTTDRTGATGDEAVYSRMLAPGFGIAEDPATGRPSGPRRCSLHEHRLIDRSRLPHAVSLQGAQMRRPS